MNEQKRFCCDQKCSQGRDCPHDDDNPAGLADLLNLTWPAIVAACIAAWVICFIGGATL